MTYSSRTTYVIDILPYEIRGIVLYISVSHWFFQGFMQCAEGSKGSTGSDFYVY